jgi:Na+/proline symporter
MSSSWTPDESSETLLAEKGWLQGTVVSAVAYGIDVALYFMCFNLLFRQMNRTNYKEHLPLLTLITLVFILSTLFMAALANFTQLAFIQYRNYPGGPNAFENNMFGIPVDNLGNACGLISMILADGLVVSREFRRWRYCR